MWPERRPIPPSAWPHRWPAGWWPGRASARAGRSRWPGRSCPVAERQHDIVVFGATGFTGGLTAEYLSAHADPGTRWALAGRSRSKLEAARSGLGQAQSELPLIEADVTDPDSIRVLAESTKVVISTVGPYINYGEPLVAA